MLHGHCLCGDIAYDIDPPLGEAHHCHCAMCRRLHGAPCSTMAQVVASGFRIVRGADQLRVYRSSPPVERTFCARCGTRMTFRFDGMPDALWVSVTTLDPEPELRLAGHIFVDSKAAWFPINDDLPQFPHYPPPPG